MTERVTYLREYEVDEAFDTTDNDAVLALTSADEDIDQGWVPGPSRSADDIRRSQTPPEHSNTAVIEYNGVT